MEQSNLRQPFDIAQRQFIKMGMNGFFYTTLNEISGQIPNYNFFDIDLKKMEQYFVLTGNVSHAKKISDLANFIQLQLEWNGMTGVGIRFSYDKKTERSGWFVEFEEPNLEMRKKFYVEQKERKLFPFFIKSGYQKEVEEIKVKEIFQKEVFQKEVESIIRSIREDFEKIETEIEEELVKVIKVMVQKIEQRI